MFNDSSSNVPNAIDLCIGLSYLTISLLLMTLNITCSYFLATDKHRSWQSFYCIAFNMAVADTIQLTFNGIPATFMTLNIISDTSYWFNNICSASMASGWIASNFQAHLLAINR
uniref:G-protein coupled receptors family 1 profile domain-containing protein n=1 Tax=Romanomermis culicivorax TaxID=13658 RepID=A0A915K582_ROMCU